MKKYKIHIHSNKLQKTLRSFFIQKKFNFLKKRFIFKNILKLVRQNEITQKKMKKTNYSFKKILKRIVLCQIIIF